MIKPSSENRCRSGLIYAPQTYGSLLIKAGTFIVRWIVAKKTPQIFQSLFSGKELQESGVLSALQKVERFTNLLLRTDLHNERQVLRPTRKRS